MPNALANLFRQVEIWWLVFGFVAQAIFFARFVAQWLASERRKTTVIPNAFWYLGLTGGVMLFAYALHQRDVVFTLGQAGSVGMSLRNIFLIDRRTGRRLAAASLLAAILLGAAALYMQRGVKVGVHEHLGWMAFGFFAQSFFFLRFLVQWLASERVKQSVMPNAFWYASLVGGLMLSLYAWHRQDPVFVIGQVAGVMIYLRNLIFIHGTRGKDVSFAVILVLLTFVLFAAKNDVPALWGSGEARVAEIAREMNATGNYLMPHLNGRVALTKPPLYHWLAALSYKLVGVDESGARLPSAVAGILAALMTYVLGRRMFGSVTGFLAAAMTASSIAFMDNARAARADMLFSFFIISAITAFFYATQSVRRAAPLYVLSFAVMGLAVMTKGPAGIFLPLAAGAAYLYLGGARDRIARVPWVPCILAFLVVLLPWHIAAAHRATAAERSYYFWGQMARWATTQGGGSDRILTSFALYVPLLLVGFFPWSLFLPAGLVAAWRDARNGRTKQLVLPFAWFAAGLAAFSLSSTKATRYLVPMLPPAALMVAYLWTESWDFLHTGAEALRARTFGALKASLGVLAAAGVLLAAAAATGPWLAASAGELLGGVLNTMDTFMIGVWRQFAIDHKVGLVVCAWSAAGLCIVAAVAAWRSRLSLSFGCVITAIVELLLVYQFAIIPKIDEILAVKPFVSQVRRLAAGEPYVMVEEPSLELIFYTAHIRAPLHPWRVAPYLAAHPRALAIVWEKLLPTLPRDVLDHAKVVAITRIKHESAIILGSPARPGASTLPTAATLLDDAEIRKAAASAPREAGSDAE